MRRLRRAEARQRRQIGRIMRLGLLAVLLAVVLVVVLAVVLAVILAVLLAVLLAVVLAVRRGLVLLRVRIGLRLRWQRIVARVAAVLRTTVRLRLLAVVAAELGERIALPDQPGEFRQWIVGRSRRAGAATIGI